ncbi:MAG: phasin family protein [Pseudomonadota bacterium]
MTESSKKSSVSGGKAARLGRDTLGAAGADKTAAAPALSDEQTNGLQAFVEANEAIMSGMTALSAEMMTFGSQRLQANLQRSGSLAACEDLDQAFQIQSAFIEAATQQYLAQTNTVLSIMTAMNRSLWAPLQVASLAMPRLTGHETD